MRFDPEYVACVLNENFEDAKAQFLAPLMAHPLRASRHARPNGHHPARAMRTRFASRSTGFRCAEIRQAAYDGTCEDLFFYRRTPDRRGVRRGSGGSAAHRALTQRHRHDDVPDAAAGDGARRSSPAPSSLREVLIALADAHREDVFAAHTHTQPAQPSTIAHYLLAVIEQLERDTVRLRAAYASNEPESARRLRDHRDRVSDRPRPHDRAARIRRADRQHLRQHRDGRLPARERVGGGGPARRARPRASRICCSGARSEFGYLRLADGFVQGSSIMPQKRNPVRSSTRARSAARRLARRAAIVLSVHNTPFGDIVDTEDDLQPLVASMFKDANRAVRLVAAAMGPAQFNRARLAERAEQGGLR